MPLTFLFNGEGESLQHWVRVSVQIAFAAMRKLKTALNFRQWTARGKGLVLLNVLVSLLSCVMLCLSYLKGLSSTVRCPSTFRHDACPMSCLL